MSDDTRVTTEGDALVLRFGEHTIYRHADGGVTLVRGDLRLSYMREEWATITDLWLTITDFLAPERREQSR